MLNEPTKIDLGQCKRIVSNLKQVWSKIKNFDIRTGLFPLEDVHEEPAEFLIINFIGFIYADDGHNIKRFIDKGLKLEQLDSSRILSAMRIEWIGFQKWRTPSEGVEKFDQLLKEICSCRPKKPNFIDNITFPSIEDPFVKMLYEICAVLLSRLAAFFCLLFSFCLFQI